MVEAKCPAAAASVEESGSASGLPLQQPAPFSSLDAAVIGLANTARDLIVQNGQLMSMIGEALEQNAQLIDLLMHEDTEADADVPRDLSGRPIKF